MSQENQISSPDSGQHFNQVDDHTIETLGRYYKIEDHGEIIRFVKKHTASPRPDKSSAD